LTILSKKSLSLEFSEAKNQRVKKCTLGGALDSAQFSSHEKSNFLANIDATGKLSRY
jgi:hypothetical protein